MKLRKNASFLPLFWIWKSIPFATSSLPSSSKIIPLQEVHELVHYTKAFFKRHAPQNILNFAIACEFCNLIIWQITPSSCFTHWLYTGMPKTILYILHASALRLFLKSNAKHSYSGISGLLQTLPSDWLSATHCPLVIADSSSERNRFSKQLQKNWHFPKLAIWFLKVVFLSD